MYCSSCGDKLPENAKFCFNCGAQSGAGTNRHSKNQNYAYFSKNTNKGLMELKKDRLILLTDVTPQLFELDKIYEVSIVKRGLFSSGKSMRFTYSGIPERRVFFETSMAEKWFITIEDAKMGK